MVSALLGFLAYLPQLQFTDEQREQFLIFLGGLAGAYIIGQSYTDGKSGGATSGNSPDALAARQASKAASLQKKAEDAQSKADAAKKSGSTGAAAVLVLLLGLGVSSPSCALVEPYGAAADAEQDRIEAEADEIRLERDILTEQDDQKRAELEAQLALVRDVRREAESRKGEAQTRIDANAALISAGAGTVPGGAPIARAILGAGGALAMLAAAFKAAA